MLERIQTPDPIRIEFSAFLKRSLNSINTLSIAERRFLNSTGFSTRQAVQYSAY